MYCYIIGGWCHWKNIPWQGEKSFIADMMRHSWVVLLEILQVVVAHFLAKSNRTWNTNCEHLKARLVHSAGVHTLKKRQQNTSVANREQWRKLIMPWVRLVRDSHRHYTLLTMGFLLVLPKEARVKLNYALTLRSLWALMINNLSYTIISPFVRCEN